MKYWKENRKLTYYRVAQNSGIDADYIKRIEESTVDNDPNIKIETLEKLADAIGVPVSELTSTDEESMYLAENERKLVTVFRCLSEEEKAAFINLIDVVSNR